jgi:hypothetical protein
MHEVFVLWDTWSKLEVKRGTRGDMTAERKQRNTESQSNRYMVRAAVL